MSDCRRSALFAEEVKLESLANPRLQSQHMEVPADLARAAGGMERLGSRLSGGRTPDAERVSSACLRTHSRTHEGPLPKGGEGMRVSGSVCWCTLTHKAAGLFGQREETPHQPPAPYSRGERKCSPHHFRNSARRLTISLFTSLRREWGHGDVVLPPRRSSSRGRVVSRDLLPSVRQEGHDSRSAAPKPGGIGAMEAGVAPGPRETFGRSS